jgi:phage shock protein A
LVAVTTARVQLERQSERLKARVPLLEEQARRALDAGREDLARAALERKQAALEQIGALDRQLAEVAQEEERLGGARRRLADRVESFRARRQIVAARYAAAAAQVRAKETLAGFSGEFAEVSLAVLRAEEKTDVLQARAVAMDVALDDLDDTEPVGAGDDAIERELHRVAAGRAIDDEIAAIKAAQQGPQAESAKNASEGEDSHGTPER